MTMYLSVIGEEEEEEAETMSKRATISHKTSDYPPSPEGHQEKKREEGSKFTCFQACALNTLNMFGTGPLVTIPYCLASVSPPGEQRFCLKLAPSQLVIIMCFNCRFRRNVN